MGKKQGGIFTIFLAVLLAHSQHADAFETYSKDSLFADIPLTELLSRLYKDIDSSNNYYDLDADMPKNIDMMSRSANPSIRDQEYLQHSSLWGHQFVSGGMGEMPNRYNTIVKTDASLPAYCNPPNPCPYGYDDSQGCISDFENTAIFSREFQEAQECTCDTEHMFDCAAQENSQSDEITSTMEFLMRQLQNDNELENSNAVVKKLYNNFEQHTNKNPFLAGDKLPIAAKKGDHIHV